MRRLLFAALALLAVVASAQEKWVESPVTLALTLSSAGEQTLKPGRAANTATRTVPLVTARLGNKEILQTLVAEGIIPEIKGWRLVAIWAYWPDEDPVAGNTYRFYARKGNGATLETVAIPSALLSVAPLVTAVGVKHSLKGEEDTIVSGSETYRVFTRLNVAAAGVFGDAHGVQSGTGKYVKVSGQVAGRYVPNSSKAPLAGLFSYDGENAAGVVGGSIAFGAGKFVTAYDYVAPSGTSYGSVSMSIGALDFDNIQIQAIPATAIGLVKDGAGTLTLSSENTFTGATTVSSGVTLGGTGTISDSTTYSGTLVIGPITPGAFNGSPATFDLFDLNTDQPLTFTTVDLSPASGSFTSAGPFVFDPTTGTLTIVPTTP